MKLTDWLLALVIGAAVLLGVAYYATSPDAPAPLAPAPMPAPQPCPPDKPCPPKPNKPKPWGPTQSASSADTVLSFGAKVAGPKYSDGTEVSCDYPGDRHRENTSSKGLGLCVFTSLHHAADWQDVEAVREMPKWMISKGIAGGGYPAKVQQLIPRIAQERGLPTPEFVQAEHYDYELLKAVHASGRMASVTYSKSPTGRYSGSRISHMVSTVHADDSHVVVLDNNYIGEQAYEWMSPAEFRQAGGLEWMVVFTSAPPPPPPHNGGPAPNPGPAPQPAPRPNGDGEPKRVPCGCSAQCTCGCNDGLPCRCAVNGVTPADPVREGVVWGKIGDKPRFRHGEYEVTRQDVLAAIESVPADGKKHRVTFIGSPEERARVDADWKGGAAIGAVKDAYLYRSYAPDHWHVARYGFGPGLTVTDSTGKELSYSKTYPGEQEVATTLRRLRPDYVPGGGGIAGGRGKSSLPLLFFGTAALGGAAIFVARRKTA